MKKRFKDVGQKVSISTASNYCFNSSVYQIKKNKKWPPKLSRALKKCVFFYSPKPKEIQLTFEKLKPETVRYFC